MKNHTLYTALLVFAFSSAASAGENNNAGENKDKLYDYGNTAHKDHCYKCHGDEVYTRDDRFVKTISALGKQVRRCKDNLGIAWFDEDTDAVIHFLNKKYYKF